MSLQQFDEVVGHVKFGIDAFKDNQITFNSFAEYIVFNNYASVAGSWLLGVCHSPQALSLSYATVAAQCRTPRSQRILRKNRISFPQSATSMNSALVEDCATVGCNFVFNAIVPPSRRKLAPPTKQRVLGQVVHSESM